MKQATRLKKTITLELTPREFELIQIALPYVGDREIEEEVPDDERIGEECDDLAVKLLENKKVSYVR